MNGSWSTTPPPESGDYWWRKDLDSDFEVLSVYVGTYSSCVWVSKGASISLEDLGGEWWSEKIAVPPRSAAEDKQ